jgi:hypothetical protein
VQFVLVSGDFAVMLPVAPSPWHSVQTGAADSGEALPVSAWQTPQLEPNPPDVTPVWAEPGKGTEWLSAPGPFAWHPTEACSAFAREAEKQEGAVLSGAVRPCV